MKEVRQKLNKAMLATIGQNKICDSLPAINKAFDILEKEIREDERERILKELPKEKKKDGFITAVFGCIDRDKVQIPVESNYNAGFNQCLKQIKDIINSNKKQ